MKILDVWLIWQYVLHEFICKINIILPVFSRGKGSKGGREFGTQSCKKMNVKNF